MTRIDLAIVFTQLSVTDVILTKRLGLRKHYSIIKKWLGKPIYKN